MNYLLLLEQLHEYYANLLIVQYNGKPKAQAHIKFLVDLVFANVILLQIQDAFDWRTAVGPQLEIIGKWVGVTKNYNGSLFWGKTYFSYPKSNQLVPIDNTDELQHGYSNYATFDDTDSDSDTDSDTGTLTYKDLGFVEQQLSDDDYRVIIGLKIIKNNINHTCKNIDDAIWEYFNHQVYTTWGNMELTYHYPESLETIMNVCEYKNVLPAPTGVKINLSKIS